MKSEKITETSEPETSKPETSKPETKTARQRWYEDACAAAHALDLLGERWALLVVRELMFSAKRFGDLRASLPGISANVLTQRLEGLEAAGVLVRRKLPPPASVQVYELTQWGREAEPIFQALGRWGARSPRHDPKLPFTPASLMLSLRTMIDPVGAAALRGTIGFRFAEQSFFGRLRDGTIDIVAGDADGADVVFIGPQGALLGVFYGKRLAEIEAQGAVAIVGDRALALRFIDLFALPQRAGG